MKTMMAIFSRCEKLSAADVDKLIQSEHSAPDIKNLDEKRGSIPSVDDTSGVSVSVDTKSVITEKSVLQSTHFKQFKYPATPYKS